LSGLPAKSKSYSKKEMAEVEQAVDLAAILESAEEKKAADLAE
jgi:hypothetical protein